MKRNLTTFQLIETNFDFLGEFFFVQNTIETNGAMKRRASDERKRKTSHIETKKQQLTGGGGEKRVIGQGESARSGVSMSEKEKMSTQRRVCQKGKAARSKSRTKDKDDEQDENEASVSLRDERR